MQFTSVRLLVSKFDECFLFYRDVIGMKVIWGNLGENYAQFETNNGAEWSIFSKKIMAEVVDTANFPSCAKTQDSVAFIFSVDDVDQFYENLMAKKVAFINPPADQPDWGIRVCHLRDPDGNLLEFMMNLAKEKFSDKLKDNFNKYSQ